MTLTVSPSASRTRLFGKTLIPEALKETIMGQFVGSGLKQETDLRDLRGDRITTTIGLNLTGLYQGTGEPTDGNEEAIAFFNDTFLVGEMSKSVKVPTIMSLDQNSVEWEYEIEAYERQKKYAAATFEIWAMNQLAGNTATAIGVAGANSPYDGRNASGGDVVKQTGNQAAIAPSASRIVRSGGAASDQALTSSNTYSLRMVDAMYEIAKNATPVFEPINYKGQEVFINIISTEQKTDLIRESGSQVQFTDISLSLLNGGQSPYKNPLMTASGFLYRNTLILENTRVPYGVNNAGGQISTVRRAIYFGKNAAAFAYKGADAGEATFFEQYFNGGRELQITANSVAGLKKVVFNSTDYAVIVGSSYAAPHTS